MKRRRQHGFTLLEIMVALVIASLGLAAVSVALQKHASDSGKMRDRTLALYVASNAIAELRLEGGYPDVGRSTNEVTFANRDWLVVTVIQESGIDGLRRIDVTVADNLNPERNIRTVAGFISRNATLPGNSVPNFSTLASAPGSSS